jgi:peroxiredoxin Q/BCP
MEIKLKVGQNAPNFEGVIQDGTTIKLSDYSGKKIVLYFYPKDNTPTCTIQACNLRDNYGALAKAGYVVIGVSPDSSRKHVNFINKYDLPFPLIADTDRSIINAYGVWGEKMLFGRKYDGVHRITFVIDENGIIEQIISKVKSKNHAIQIMKSAG